MKQKDKNIFIIVVFVIIALLFWSLNNYNSTTKMLNNEKKVKLKQKENFKEKSNLKQKFAQRKKNNLIPIISISELNKKILTDNTLIIVDTRSAKSFKNEHIKNSLHISEFDINRQRRIIVFITEQGNEKSIIQYYHDISNTNKIYNLKGGFEAWKKSGHPIITLNIKHTFENQAKVQFVEPRDLNKLLLKMTSPEFTIIDTRRYGNYKKEHIPTAINIPFDNLEKEYKKIPIAKKIYVYDTDDNSSFEAGVLLYDLGFIGTKTITGGFNAWKEYDYPITIE